MSDAKEPAGRADFEAMIISKAWKDPAYKEELLENPKTVFERELKEVAGGSQTT